MKQPLSAFLRNRRFRRGPVLVGMLVIFAVAAFALLAGAIVSTFTGNDEDSPVLTDRVVPGAVKNGNALDCTAASTVTVRVSGSEIVASQADVEVKAGDAFRLVVDSDRPVMLRPSGSTVQSQEMSAGLSALCVAYRSVGTYAVVLDDVVPLQVTVTAPDSGSDADAGSATDR